MKKLIQLLKIKIRRLLKIDKSYHDVVIIIDGKRYDLFNLPYGYQITCTRVGGWELWYKEFDMEYKQVGGEYDSKSFQIEVAGKIICG